MNGYILEGSTTTGLQSKELMDETESKYEEALLNLGKATSSESYRTIQYIRNHLRYFPEKRLKTLELFLSLVSKEEQYALKQQIVSTIITLLTQARDKSLESLVLPYLFYENSFFQRRLIRYFGDLGIREAVPYLSQLLPDQNSEMQYHIVRALRKIATADALFIVHEWEKRKI
jgi:hypothetical protein